MRSIVIFGAADQAKVAVEAIERLEQMRILGFVAATRPTATTRYPLLGSDEDVTRLWQEHGPFDAHIALLDAATRRRIADRLKRELPAIEFPAIVHPLARVAKGAVVEHGSFIAIGATICVDARIGRHVIVNTNASVDHDCVLGDFSFLGPNAALGGAVNVGDNAFVGLGAAVLPYKRIGANAVVGAGAVVVDDVAEGMTVVGVPARPRK